MPDPLPVTIVSGFLGSGKTSLLHHFITAHQGGHLAVLVENSGPVNLDAKAIRGLTGAMRRQQDAVYEIPNAEGPQQIAAIANCLRDLAQSSRFERVLIELSGTSSAAWLAREFAQWSEFATLSQAVCVVDALDYGRAVRMPKEPWSAFLDEQISGATLAVLNKCDLVADSHRELCLSSLNKRHPGLHVIETSYGEIPPEILTQPATAPKVREAEKRHAHRLETPANVPSMAAALYRVHRPFHPQRFWDWFNEGHPGLLRVKGIIWIASRSLLVGGVSRTTWQNSCGAAGIWWAALPREEWPEEVEKLQLMQQTWREPYGDRRQELVVIGDEPYLNASLRRELDACLLTDEEYSRPFAEWSQFPDPFPEWDVES